MPKDSNGSRKNNHRGRRTALWAFTLNLGANSSTWNKMAIADIEDAEALVNVDANLPIVIRKNPSDTAGSTDGVKFFTGQLELGLTGNYHIQGVVQLEKRTFMKNAVKIIKLLCAAFVSGTQNPLAPHVEWCGATLEQNVAYCTKEESRAGGFIMRYGSREGLGQGVRTDIHSAVAALRAYNGDMRCLLDDSGSGALLTTLVKYPSGLSKVARLMGLGAIGASKIKKKPTVKWFYGLTGSGKTFRAITEGEAIGEVCVIRPPQKNRPFYWDDYCGQPCVVIDELRPESLNFTTLLGLLDAYVISVDCRGYNAVMNSDYIFITSGTSPPSDFVPDGEDEQQLLRRIDSVVHLTEPWADAQAPESPDVVELSSFEDSDGPWTVASSE